MFSKTAVCAMLGTLALVSSAALPAQAATAPGKRTIVVSHAGPKKLYDIVLTFRARQPMSAATAAKVKLVLAKAVNAPEKIAGVLASSAAGPDGAQLYCDNAYSFSDPDGTFTFQHSCGGSTGPWGYQLNDGVCSLIPGGINGDVAETGMMWTRNGVTQGMQAPHPLGFCGRTFHGTFNPDQDNDNITYKDTFNFTIEVDGETGPADVQISGNFTSLGCQNRIACGP
jgi:hypothetical protein